MHFCSRFWSSLSCVQAGTWQRMNLRRLPHAWRICMVRPRLLDYYGKKRLNGNLTSESCIMFHSCILVINHGEMESHLLVNMQWSFQMVQASLQTSKSIGNIERWYYFMSLLQILLWAKSNIRWCQPFATETSSALNAYLPSKLFFLNGVQGKFFCGIFSDAIASQVVQDWSSHQARSRILKPVTKIINANDEPSHISKYL